MTTKHVNQDHDTTPIDALSGGTTTTTIAVDLTVQSPVRAPDADQFRAGDIWENSRGTRHRVMLVDAGIAYLVNEKTRCTCKRKRFDIGWDTGRPWVRVLSGTADRT